MTPPWPVPLPGPQAPWRLAAVVLLAGCLCAAAAQEVRATGAAGAHLALDVSVDLAPSLELRLGASTIDLDLRALGSELAPACVLGTGPDRVVTADRDGNDRIAPAGTSFQVTDGPAIEVTGGSPIAVYPPPSGVLVCYVTFELRTFANVSGWQLAVSRADRGAFPPLYLAGVCPGDPGNGLIPLPDGERRTLQQDRGNGVCHELLVVVAIRVDGVTAGTALTDLQYTLLAADADFGGE